MSDINIVQQQQQHQSPQPQQEQRQNATNSNSKQINNTLQSQNNMNANNNNNNNNNNSNNNSNPDDNNNNIDGAADGILSSPTNPATLRRLSQTKDDKGTEVSWHKRVVVHRVPRSDASRSMFHAKGKEANNSNQCCILL